MFGLLVPGWRHGWAVVVVDSDLLAWEDRGHGYQGHHLAEPVMKGHNMTLLSYHDPPGVLHPPEPDVRCEGVVGLVCEGDAVLLQLAHVGGNVYGELGAEVHPVV